MVQSYSILKHLVIWEQCLFEEYGFRLSSLVIRYNLSTKSRAICSIKTRLYLWDKYTYIVSSKLKRYSGHTLIAVLELIISKAQKNVTTKSYMSVCFLYKALISSFYIHFINLTKWTFHVRASTYTRTNAHTHTGESL
jgi:hypothetical protein